MRGKKTDSDFLSEFIVDSVKLGFNTPIEFIEHAKKIIKDIELEIQRVDKLKIKRGKLLDVVSVFETPKKNNNIEEIIALSFFKIKQPLVCKYICDTVKKSPVTIESFSENFSTEDIMFCIKQLIENKIIVKINNLFSRGELFDNYYKFTLRDG